MRADYTTYKFYYINECISTIDVYPNNPIVLSAMENYSVWSYDGFYINSYADENGNIYTKDSYLHYYENRTEIVLDAKDYTVAIHLTLPDNKFVKENIHYSFPDTWIHQDNILYNVPANDNFSLSEISDCISILTMGIGFFANDDTITETEPIAYSYPEIITTIKGFKGKILNTETQDYDEIIYECNDIIKLDDSISLELLIEDIAWVPESYFNDNEQLKSLTFEGAYYDSDFTKKIADEITSFFDVYENGEFIGDIFLKYIAESSNIKYYSEGQWINCESFIYWNGEFIKCDINKTY